MCFLWRSEDKSLIAHALTEVMFSRLLCSGVIAQSQVIISNETHCVLSENASLKSQKK
jgi:hypothetical protein